ncbi:MAG: major facilitator superfamily [Rhizobacter sp.]|nr:major facilitator superfamily [Rhizobacter sp.]
MPVFAIFALCALTNGFAARLADPLVLPVSAHFMVAASLAAMLNTAYALPYAFAQPLLGPLGDRFSKERCIQICATGLGLSLALGAFAPSFGLLMASRIAAGIFAGGMTPLVLAALGDRYGMAERQVMIGRMLFAIIGGQMLGSAVSGFAEQAFGWRSALVIGAVMGISAAVFAWQGLRPAPIAPAADAAPKPSMRALYAKVFDNPTSLWLYGCVIFEGALFFGLFPFVGELLVHSTGAVATDVGRQTGLVLGAFGVGGLFYALLVRRVLRVMGMRRMCLIGSIVTALC